MFIKIKDNNNNWIIIYNNKIKDNNNNWIIPYNNKNIIIILIFKLFDIIYLYLLSYIYLYYIILPILYCLYNCLFCKIILY